MKVELEHVLQSVSCTQAARQRGASAHRLIDEPGRARLTRPERSNSGHSSATLSNQPALASEITHLLETCEICGLDDLGSPHTTPANDVRLLALLLSGYASVFRRVPLGMHQEIVAALRGDNSRSIQYIPEGHPAVNANNEITDRWNKPFFFHVISSNAVEIISAGPDRVVFTDDDIRDVPPHATVEPSLSMASETPID